MIDQAYVNFRGYNGFGYPVMELTDLADAREAAADFLIRARGCGHDITTLAIGTSWEIQTQMNLDGIAVTDADGYLSLCIVSRPDAEVEDEEWDD